MTGVLIFLEYKESKEGTYERQRGKIWQKHLYHLVNKRNIFEVMLEKQVEKLSETALKTLSPSADNSESQLRQ